MVENRPVRTPVIAPIKSKQYTCKQSVCDHVPKLPMRSMLLAPSGGGKTVLLQNMILDIYKGCLNIIYIYLAQVLTLTIHGDQSRNI